MTPLLERKKIVSWVVEAVIAGARKRRACEMANVSIRTLQRWCDEDGCVGSDKRPDAAHSTPKSSLTDTERERILSVCSEKEFASLPPSQIVPILADRGVYIASEATFYRVLKAAGQLKHRGKSKPKNSVGKPRSYTASKPKQLWSWDISYLPTRVKGMHFFLYLIVDIFSRKIVGAEVYDIESGEHASNLLQRSVLIEKCSGVQLVLHSDNGAPMKCQTMLSKMYELGVVGSRSRPRVSNDNPYSESLFRTLKYCPLWPSEGFNTIEDARAWVGVFVDWYNLEHRHSAIKFVTPNQRHQGEDTKILADRNGLYESAKVLNPSRWSGSTRDWSVQGNVELNPEVKKKAA